MGSHDGGGSGQQLFRTLNQLNLVAFRGVHEGKAAAVRAQVGAVREGDSQRGDVFPESGETLDFKGQMREVRLDVHGAAGREIAQFDQFLAFGGLHEDQFRTARGFVAAGFHQTEDVAVEFDGPFQIIHPVAGVMKLLHSIHLLKHSAGWGMGQRGICAGLLRVRVWGMKEAVCCMAIIPQPFRHYKLGPPKAGARQQILTQWRGMDWTAVEKTREKSRKAADILPAVLKELRIERRQSEAEVLTVWNHLIDPLVAAHAQPTGLNKGTLFVTVDSSVWLDEIVRYQRKEILKRLQHSFGPQMITKISFRVG